MTTRAGPWDRLLLGHQDDMEPVGQAGTAAEAIKLARI
jgi:hypothetical protein